VTFDREVLADLRSRVSAIDARRRTLLVGIDGHGGSGKSTLDRDLASLLSVATVVQFDDFYRPARERRSGAGRVDGEIAGDFDWRRVRNQVLKPLTTDETARYPALRLGQ
jgi:uridine kinase